jgi:hypothetical protein
MGDANRRLKDRRSDKGRRSGVDVRTDAEKKLVGERRSNKNRRSGSDRRSSTATPDVR